MLKLHHSLTKDVLLAAAERETFGTDNPGFCIMCGSEQEGCEPDATGYECDECGSPAVYGAAYLLQEHTELRDPGDDPMNAALALGGKVTFWIVRQAVYCYVTDQYIPFDKFGDENVIDGDWFWENFREQVEELQMSFTDTLFERVSDEFDGDIPDACIRKITAEAQK